MVKKTSVDYNEVISFVAAAGKPNFFKGAFIVLELAWKFSIPGLMLEYISQSVKKENSDAENIREIIKSGKENGLEELEIVITKEQGIRIGSDLKTLGIPVDVSLEAKGGQSMVIKAKYK